MMVVLCLGLGQRVTVRKLAKVQKATVTSQEHLLCTRHESRKRVVVKWEGAPGECGAVMLIMKGEHHMTAQHRHSLAVCPSTPEASLKALPGPMLLTGQQSLHFKIVVSYHLRILSTPAQYIHRFLFIHNVVVKKKKIRLWAQTVNVHPGSSAGQVT